MPDRFRDTSSSATILIFIIIATGCVVCLDWWSDIPGLQHALPWLGTLNGRTTVDVVLLLLLLCVFWWASRIMHRHEAMRRQALATLRESEQRFRIFFERSMIGTCLITHDGTLLQVNAAFADMLGFSIDELLQINLKTITHPDDLAISRECMRGLLAGECANARIEKRYLHKDGHAIWFAIRLTLLRDDEGSPLYFIVNIIDITERKHALEALRVSQRLIEGILNAIPVRVFWKDTHLVYQGCNLAFARDAGYTDPKDIIGKDDYHLTWQAQADLYRHDDREVIESGCAKLLIEEPLTTPDGTIITLLTSKVPLRGVDGAVDGILGAYMDITERKAVDAALRASEVRYRRLFESAQDGILIIDAETGYIMDVNPFLMNMLDYTVDEFRGKKLWEIGVFADIVANKAAFIELQQKRYIRYDDLPLETKNGRKIDVEFVSNVYLVNNANIIQCNIRDISQRKQAEALREKLEEQLRQQQRLESVGQLAAGVAHDFNNLLTGISGFTHFAHDALPAGTTAREDLTEVLALAGRAANLTRQLLAFSRRQTLQPIIIDINQQIGEMVKMLAILIGEHIDLAFRPATDIGAVKADPGQIEQVLVNLAINARDAMPDGGKLTIETANVTLDDDYAHLHLGTVPGPHVMLAVTDNGCGMDSAVIAQIFEPFFSTKGVGKGTGLGLSTVYGIVKQHNGSIQVYSEPGKGSTFKVYLPRVTESSAAPESSSTPAVLIGCETILIVEDEEAVRHVAARILAKQGYQVLTAALPSLADEMLAAHGEKITLLLTDMVMPERSGYQLYESAHARYPHLRVLYMSGYTDIAMAHQGMLVDGTPFIQKPFIAEALLGKVRQVLDGVPLPEISHQ